MTKAENPSGLIIVGETQSDSSTFVQTDTSLDTTELSVAEQRESAALEKQRLIKANEKLRKAREAEEDAPKLGTVFRPAPRSFSGLSAGVTEVAEFTLIGTLGEINDGRTNTVPAAALFDTADQNDNVMLEIPKWDPTTVDPQYDGTQDQVFIWTVEPSENPDLGDTDVYRMWPEALASYTQPVVDEGSFTVNLPPAFLNKYPEGTLSILYSVANESIGNHAKSQAQTIYLDKRPPSYRRDPGAIVPPASIPANGVITKEILDANTNFQFTVPVYSLSWPGDRIRVYDRESGVLVYEGVLWDEAADARLDTITVPSTALRALGEGPKSIVYKLIDRAGWESSASDVRSFSFELQPQPTVLPAPIIRTAPINREVLRAGVKIELPVIANAAPDDQIVMRLISPTGIKTLETFPYSAGFTTANWDDIAVPDGQAEYSLRVEYDLKRGSATHGPSSAATVAVNLKTVGPRPIDPGPVNDQLVPLLIRGGVDRKDNEIGPADAGVAASVSFTVYEGAALGHVVRFFYDGVSAGTYDVKDTDAEGDVVALTLDWSLIRDHGNGTKLAYYEVYESAAASNFQRSPSTDVVVTAITVTVSTYVEYEYLKANFQNKLPGAAIATTGIINCAASPWRGVRVRVRLTDAAIAVGDIIRLDWAFALDARGLNVKESTRLKLEVPVTQVHISSKLVSILVPYNQENFGGQENGENVLEGSIVCFFTLIKPGDVIGISTPTMARYSAKQSGVRCANWVD